jgi:hypothetical protein
MKSLEERIRERAYQIWRDEGCPQGREKDHWELASELIAIEDNQLLATKPVHQERLGPHGEPIEPLESIENTGEFPTVVDQGEQKPPARRRRATGARSGARGEKRQNQPAK